MYVALANEGIVCVLYKHSEHSLIFISHSNRTVIISLVGMQLCDTFPGSCISG